MNTNIEEKDGKYVVALEGELDTAHALVMPLTSCRISGET